MTASFIYLSLSAQCQFTFLVCIAVVFLLRPVQQVRMFAKLSNRGWSPVLHEQLDNYSLFHPNSADISDVCRSAD